MLAIELGKGIGRLFLHPLLYWTVIVFLLIGYERIKRERAHFGVKIHRYFSEGRGTLLLAILFSILLSCIVIVFGLTLSLEAIVVLAFVTFLFSFIRPPMLLSAAYTIGITFIILFVTSFLQFSFRDPFHILQTTTSEQFVSLAIFTGLLLIVEAFLIGRNGKSRSFPSLVQSKRGIWIGQHELRCVMLIPFFVLIPYSIDSTLTPFYPIFQLGETTYSLFLVPFLIGYRYPTTTQLPRDLARRISNATLLLSFLVLLVAISSIYYVMLAYVAIGLAVIGKEWIMYRHRRKEEHGQAIFTPLNRGIKVVATIPGSPAERLEILVGETVLRVNDVDVNNPSEYYEALQNSGAFVKLEIADERGEIRFVRSAFYEEDHYKLGIIFAEHIDERMPTAK